MREWEKKSKNTKKKFNKVKMAMEKYLFLYKYAENQQ